MKRVLVMVLALSGCSSSNDPTVDMPADHRVAEDAARPDAGASDVAVTDLPTADAPDGTVGAADYCESTVDMFCAYYLRCGRIDATDQADCRSKFLETCNAVFEPQYVALADRGQLRLSAEGIASCAAHLDEVECSRHIFDLDGPCDAVWTGQAAAGEPCAPGVGVFVCAEGTECVLDLSLCGVCEPAGTAGEPCVEGRCDRESTCIADNCVARGLTSDACGDEQICATGLACADGECTAYAVANPGGSCATARCPYQSTCIADVCVTDARLGESCANGEICGSGFCDGEVCQPFRGDGAACGASMQCLSARCENATCAPTISTCFDP